MKNVLVSGGSRGLGLEFCEHQLKKGAKVFSFARKSTDEVHSLREKYKGQFDFRTFDITESCSIKGIVTGAIDFMGGIDVLINNAAVGQDHLLAHCSEENIASIIGKTI